MSTLVLTRVSWRDPQLQYALVPSKGQRKVTALLPFCKSVYEDEVSFDIILLAMIRVVMRVCFLGGVGKRFQTSLVN